MKEKINQAESVRKRSRYQTYVFDSEFDVDPKSKKKFRDMLGPEYKGGVPVAWQDGNALREKDRLKDFIDKILLDEFDSIEYIQDAADKLFEELKIG